MNRTSWYLAYLNFTESYENGWAIQAHLITSSFCQAEINAESNIFL